MTKLVLATVAVISLAAALPAVAQQSGPSHQSTAGQSSAQGNKGDAQHGNDGNASFKFKQSEIRQMQDEIREVQQALSTKGYNVGKADGFLGRRTAQALEKFQRQEGIKATGKIDSRTASVLGVPSLGKQHAGRAESQPSTTGSAANPRHRPTQSPAGQGK